jgi:hypothetical protein
MLVSTLVLMFVPEVDGGHLATSRRELTSLAEEKLPVVPDDISAGAL